ncbi:type IV secretion system protein [Mesorhizobium sp. CA13]|uniref:type IV secretion system protein n=1 Tax=unclassified Mesorhizobium TaxID=325217 RepID=UPI0011262FCC|nr:MULTISPECIES: type IV secretion system protein [unclassified Mesorhizobium]MBZ9857387.1 type IV secretion system protein [Mesorhizobium sp. CA13]MBZ9967776.1 type IV secretion system protein [Mesorhizobium sp. BR1-1-2]MCA0016395.1 type IV secretion system protein [Mesorhizobium sp. B294B1A1]MCA0038442.1 type IV secretion system protein [Mesorhizobium sp. B292B1B]TPM37328.1 conjugal transfer protein [Mesorhizobium sp. B2-3-2]
MRALLLLVTTAIAVTSAKADIPVIDKTNYAVARDTAEKTARILDINRDILTTVEKTLQAVTGDRGSDAGSLKDLAIGNGFSVSSVPSFDRLLQNGVPDFGAMGPEIAKAATVFINGMQLVKSLSGKQGSSLASDRSYEELVKTVLGVSALIAGSRQAIETRRAALERAGQRIGQARDIKGSIDQNTQLQVQTGLTLNEMIGVLNSAVQSLQAENQRKLTDISNTKKALTYQ